MMKTMINKPLQFKVYDERRERFLYPSERSAVDMRLDSYGRLYSPNDDLMFLMNTYKRDKENNFMYELDVVEVDLPTKFGVIKEKGVMRWVDKPGMFTVMVHSELMGSPNGSNQYAVRNPKRLGNLVDNNDLLSDEEIEKINVPAMQGAIHDPE